MSAEQKTVVLNGGRDFPVGLVAGADDYLQSLLADAPAKQGWATLKVVKNSAGRPFVAVIIGNKHVGFLTQAAAPEFVPTLCACEELGGMAKAKGTVQAGADAAGKPRLKISLAAPDELLTTPAAHAAAPSNGNGNGDGNGNGAHATTGNGNGSGAATLAAVLPASGNGNGNGNGNGAAKLVAVVPSNDSGNGNGAAKAAPANGAAQAPAPGGNGASAATLAGAAPTNGNGNGAAKTAPTNGAANPTAVSPSAEPTVVVPGLTPGLVARIAPAATHPVVRAAYGPLAPVAGQVVPVAASPAASAVPAASQGQHFGPVSDDPNGPQGMHCPRCGAPHPFDAARCDCGHSFYGNISVANKRIIGQSPIELPLGCVKCGERAHDGRRFDRVLYYCAPWVWVTFLVGAWLVPLILYVTTRKPVKVGYSLCDACSKKQDLKKIAAIAGWVLFLAVIVASVATENVMLAAFGIPVVFLGAVVASVLANPPLRVAGMNQGYFELAGASPLFRSRVQESLR